MAEVKIILEGYFSGEFDAGEERSIPTITLIKDRDFLIIVDPGVLPEQSLLVSALKKNGTEISDINMIFITHSHLDHYRNMGMFPEAKALDFYGLWHGDKVEDWNENFSEDIRIIKTPGHAKTSLSFLIKTKDGIVAIVGDLFWKENFPKSDPYADEPEKLEESRKKILENSDWLIPGHGKMCRVKK